MAVRLGLGSLYNEVQCIMGNGDMRIYAVDRITYRQIDTTEKINIPQLLCRAVKISISP